MNKLCVKYPVFVTSIICSIFIPFITYAFLITWVTMVVTIPLFCFVVWHLEGMHTGKHRNWIL